MKDFKQFDSDEDNVDMSSNNATDTDNESESDDNQDLLEIINDIKSTFDYSLQLRKKFREKIEDMEIYDQDEWTEILKSYAKLEAAVKDETDGLDNADKGEEEEKEDFWDFIYEFKHVLKKV